jgi:hypothetical protein
MAMRRENYLFSHCGLGGKKNKERQRLKNKKKIEKTISISNSIADP